MTSDMTLWVKLDFNDEDCNGYDIKGFTDIASVKKDFGRDHSVAKHNGKVMEDESLVPQTTTEDNPLHLLQEICKAHAMTFNLRYILISGIYMCTIDEPHEDKYQEKIGHATQKISKILSPKKGQILIYNDQVLSFETELRDLETTKNNRLLVVCTLGKYNDLLIIIVFYNYYTY